MSAPALAKHPRISRVQMDFEHLLDRMRRRLYIETLDTLAFYWLKTAYMSGYQRADWVEVDCLLHRMIDGIQAPDELSATLRKLRVWLVDQDLISGGAPPRPEKTFFSQRPSKSDPEAVARYFVRLLNDWVPKEVARLLLEETERSTPSGAGIPAAAVASSAERLLIREQLPREFLEKALQATLFSPHAVYPADYEVLRDVILFLLGRTDAPAYDTLPATLVWTSSASHFQSDYADAFGYAEIVTGADGEMLHVPITNAQTNEIIKADPFRLTSIVVTMDGRWWQSHALATGDRNAVTYRPMGRFRIDYSSDAARLQVPWPESCIDGSGTVSLPSHLEVFGRQWRMSRWQLAADSITADLVSTGPLPVTATGRRCRPASVDIAWTALQNAFEQSIAEKSGEPMEKLRQGDFVPLGRALYSLAECLRKRRQRTPDVIAARLSAVSYHATALRQVYGPVPIRVLPESVREALLERRIYRAVAETLRDTFEGFPELPDAPPPLLTRWLTRRAA